MNQKFEFNEIETDGSIRTIAATYDDPSYTKRLDFTTPISALPLTISTHIDVLSMRLGLEPRLQHTRFYTVKIFDIDKVILNRVSQMSQQNLDGSYSDQAFRNFFHGNVMILDFSSESLEYTQNLAKYAATHRLPRAVSDLSHMLNEVRADMPTAEFSRIRARALAQFWEGVLSDSRTLNEFEGKIFDEGRRSRGDIILPFMKLVKNMTDLSYAKAINSIWGQISRIHDKPVVAYLLLHPSALRDESVVYGITEYIESLRGIDILVLKIKNLDVTGGSNHIVPREHLKEILTSISKKKQKEKILTVALEAGEQFWPFSLQFDVVSTSASMRDKEMTGFDGTLGGRQSYGKAVDEHSLALVDFPSWQKEFNKTGVFPCSHDFCHERIRTLNEPPYTNRRWWTDSRLHNIQVFDAWMKMVSDAVIRREGMLAFSRLGNSPLKVLTELLPSDYNSF